MQGADMRRLEFIAGRGVAATRGQQAKVHRFGCLQVVSERVVMPYENGIPDRFRELEYVEGTNFIFDTRYTRTV
jgi:hypothetical protein